MSEEKFISDKELEEIEKIEVDDELLKKLKTKQKNNFFQELIYKALEKVKEQLEDDEEIEIYFNGKNYNSNLSRVLLTMVVPILSHPVMGWFANIIIIKTNKRILVMETDAYYQYLTHYEISKEIHICTEKEFAYLKIKNMEGKEKIIQYSINKVESLIENLGEQFTIIKDKKIKSMQNIIYKIIVITEITALILFFLYYIGHYLMTGELYL